MHYRWQRVREAIRPAGAICSTVVDMAQFMRFHLSDGCVNGRQLLKTSTILEMQSLHSVLALTTPRNQILPYSQFLSGWGLGWEIRDYRGRKVVMHRGSTGAVLALMPDEKIGIVVLTNRDCGIQYMVMHDVFDRMLGIPRSWSNRDWTAEVIDKPRLQSDAKNSQLESDRKKQVAPGFPMRDYTGTYESDLYGVMVIGLADGKLTLQLGPNCSAVVSHWQGDRFRARFVVRHSEDWFLTFHATADRRSAALEINQAQSGKLISTFARIREDGDGAGSSLRTR